MNYGAVITCDNGEEQIVFKKDGGFIITATPNLSSISVDTTESQTVGQIGVTVNGLSVKAKTITITGSIMENVELNRAKMIRVLRPQAPIKLIYAYNNQRWYLDCVLSQTPLISAGIVFQDFQFQLNAAYPYWRDANEIDENLAGLQKLFKFPFNTGGRWYLSKFSDNYYKTIFNNGNVPLGIQFSIYARGEFTAPEILHMGTGEKLTINRTFVKGESVFINTEYGRRGVQITDVNGVTSNGFRYLVEGQDGDIGMQLMPGENIFRYDATNGRDLGRVTIHFPQNGVVSGV